MDCVGLSEHETMWNVQKYHVHNFLPALGWASSQREGASVSPVSDEVDTLLKYLDT
jgi:hypothetical protein